MPGAPLFIHIGLQKTGTSYLQSIFWQSVDSLREQGLDMVPGSKRATFHLMLDVRARYNPDFDPPEVARALAGLPALLAESTGSRALITEESLAASTHDQIERLLAACAGREVHVIITLRDLARQIPSAWQQSLQGGSAEKFGKYLKRLTDSEGAGSRPWRNKDIPEILARWAAHVPADRIHVVTVPPSGNDPELLLRRYCDVLGVDAGALDRQVARSNESLRHVNAEVLRRVNDKLARDFRRRDVYGDIGKRFFAVRILGRDGGRRIQVPRSLEEWCRAVSASHIEFIKSSGFDVVGDLSDLEPADSSFSDEPTKAKESEVADAATEAIALMLSGQMQKLRQRRLKATHPTGVRKLRALVRRRRG